MLSSRSDVIDANYGSKTTYIWWFTPAFTKATLDHTLAALKEESN
jgi:hypothetical protein